MTATQAMPVAASSRKQELQTQKSQTQSKLSEAESQVNTLENKKNELMGQIDSTQQELVYDHDTDRYAEGRDHR